MLFNSFSFLFLFLPLALAIASRLRGQWLLAFVAGASFLFYAWAGEPWFLVPMLFTILLDFILARFLGATSDPRKRMALLLVSLFFNLGFLVFFKYAGLIGQHTGILASLVALGLPAGISFYTFQSVSYMVDVYRKEKEPEKNILKYAGFISFFPHLVAGPLTRHSQLIPQLSRVSAEGIRPHWRGGIALFVIGLAKKVIIADRIDDSVGPLLSFGGQLDFFSAWLALFGFTLQIYFDFSGYSDMAIGLGRLFGIELPQNFNSPYQATSPRDFWARWHITLSQFFRDYLYIPLGGSRHGNLRTALNLLLTMFLAGLWHGATWLFGLWGIYHAFWLILHHQGEGAWNRMPSALQKIITLLIVMCGWVIFSSGSLRQCAGWMSALLGGRGLGDLSAVDPLLLPLLFTAGVIALFLPNASRRNFNEMRAGLQLQLAGAFVVAVLMIHFSSKFIYFKF
ncbi:MAG: MBOAT family protein [Bacteriovoracia bacterium]